MTETHTWPPSLQLLFRQASHQLRLFLRVPVAVFFTIALPFVVLLIINATSGERFLSDTNGDWPVDAFVCVAIAAFTAVSATFTNLANMVPIRREEGVLQRWRSTPLPVWVLVGGHILSAVVIAVLSALFMLGVGVALYGVQISLAAVPALILTMLVATLSFAAMGMAVAAVVPTASAASGIANAIILPMALISNVFIPMEDPPAAIDILANLFPLRPFVDALQAPLHPMNPTTAPQWGSLGVIALWGLVGFAVAVRQFRWNAAPGGSTRRRRSRSQ
ncbi:MAG: ABC transporter permease [Ilumatobacteraceae bacterium]